MKGKIIYIGEDSDFIDKINAFISSRNYTEQVFYHCKMSDNTIVDVCSRFHPNIVIIDFINENRTLNEFFKQLRFIKNNLNFFHILFAGIWADVESLQCADFIFSSGMIYSYMAGGELKNFLEDLFYITYSTSAFFPKYARANQINQMFQIESIGVLSALSDTLWKIDSDFNPENGEVIIRQNLFPQLENPSFKIIKSSNISDRCPFLYNLSAKIPFCGAWEEDAPGLLMNDTYETQIKMKMEDGNFCGQDKSCIVVTHNQENIIEYFKLSLVAPLWIEICDLSKESEERIFHKKPQILIFDLNSATDEKFGLDSINLYMERALMDVRAAPIILIFNCPTKSTSLQKLYHFPKLISSENKLSIVSLQTLLNNFWERNKRETLFGEKFMYLNPSKDTILYLNISIMLTSLTEHEITFYCKEKLPIFSVYRVDIGIKMLLTIVPTFRELDSSAHGTHYMGFIHGIDENGLNDLRKLINQIIYRPLAQFTLEELRQAILRKEDVKTKVSKCEVQINQTKEQVETISESEILKSKVKRMSGFKYKL